MLHLLLLPAFPLLAGSVWALLRGERGPAAWGARVLSGAYAVLYGALDAIAGVGAAHQVLRTADRGDPRPPIEDLFDIADPLGALGVYALAAAVLLTGVLLWLRTRSVLALVAVAVGLALLEVSRRESPGRG